MKQRQGVYIRRWFFECMYNNYPQGIAMTYIHVLGKQRLKNSFDKEIGEKLSIEDKLLKNFKST